MSETPEPGPGYLEEAADQLRKARDFNEKRRTLAEELAAGKLRTDDIDREVADRSMEIAAGFVRLAAIKAGMNPEDLP